MAGKLTRDRDQWLDSLLLGVKEEIDSGRAKTNNLNTPENHDLPVSTRDMFGRKE